MVEYIIEEVHCSRIVQSFPSFAKNTHLSMAEFLHRSGAFSFRAGESGLRGESGTSGS